MSLVYYVNIVFKTTFFSFIRNVDHRTGGPMHDVLQGDIVSKE